MKIEEIIELTQTTPLNQIAKEHLTIGEKKAREGMKAAGAEPQRGKKGWTFNGDPENLEKSIYEFAPPSQRGRRKANTSEQKLVETNEGEQKPVENSSSEQKPTKDSTSEPKQLAASKRQPKLATTSNKQPSLPDEEIDAIGYILANRQTEKPKKTNYRGFYLDEDITEILDALGRGDKSKIANEIFRAEFVRRGILEK